MNFSPLAPTPIREPAPSSSNGRALADSVAVQSRLLAGMAYDHDQTILQLEFHGGTVYQYFQVPSQTYQDLLQAGSKGAYFNRHIRNVFCCIRLGARHVASGFNSAVPK
jgi:hypothetical protein